MPLLYHAYVYLEFLILACTIYILAPLIITPDAEKAEIAKAEAEFMEKEMKKLQKKFQKEKEMIHAQFVAEQAPQYAAEREVQ